MSPKAKGTLHQAIAYVVATAISCLVGWYVHDTYAPHILVSIGIADVVGTIIVFAFSRIHDNSSLYDPYWSVAPIVIAGGYAVWAEEVTIRAVIASTLVFWWGARLTYNFLRGWSGLDHEDWRYDDFRTQFPRAYWLVSFWGVHFFPTVMVFAGCLAFYPIFTSTAPLGVLDALGVCITVGAILIETVADKQLHNYIKRGPSREEWLDEGLWRYSRHPNYFGELSFWYGLFVLGLAAHPMWWTAAGPAIMTFLFFVISVPLIDKRHLKRRPKYAEHIKRVSGIIPMPRRD